jgi:hypothetical protein
MAEIFASSSVVLINNLDSTIVYCSALSSIGNFLTVRDNTGIFRSTNAIYVSSLSGAIIEGNIGPLKIIDPYGFVTLNTKYGNQFTAGNPLAFPLGQQTANLDAVEADNITVLSTFQMIDEASGSTNIMYLSSQNFLLNNNIIGELSEADLLSTIDGLGTAGYKSTIIAEPIVTQPPIWLAGGFSSNTALSVFTPPGASSTIVGTIQYSYDGFRWQNANGGFTTRCTGITYGNGVFVAVGDYWPTPGGIFGRSAGYHQWSYDGINWNFANPVILDGTSNFNGQYSRYGVTFNNGLFHSYGYAQFGCEETILWSKDGSNWQLSPSCPFPSPFGQNAYCSGIAFGNGVWVASGLVPTNTTPQGALIWSTDGSNWSNAQTAVWNTFISGGPSYAEARDVKFDGTKFIALQVQGTNPSSSNICYSYDGKNWTSVGITNGNWNNNVLRLGLNGPDGLILTRVNNARLLTSSNDGFSWSNNTNLATSNGQNYSLENNSTPYFDGTKWYFGIDKPYNSTDDSQNLYYSYDLTTWTNSNISSGFIRGGFPIAFCYFPGSDNYIQALESTNRTIGPTFNTSSITTNNISTNTFFSATANISSVFAIFTSTNTTIELINNVTDQFVRFLSTGVFEAPNGFISSLSVNFVSTDILRVDNTVNTFTNANTSFMYADTITASNLNVCTIYTKLGLQSGAFNQGSNSVAIGNSAGQFDQGQNSVAIGFEAGNSNQGSNSVAIGYRAGAVNQSSNAVAIGSQAGELNQSTNTIVINASGFPLNTTRSNAFYVSPIREENIIVSLKPLYYNNTSKEIYSGLSVLSSFSTIFISTLLINKTSSPFNLDVSGSAQFSTIGNIFIESDKPTNGMALTWNSIQTGQRNTEFIASKGPLDQNGWFNFYTGVNNNTNPDGSNLTFTIGKSSIGINISTPQFEVDVLDRVRVNSTISTLELFFSSINGFQYNSTASVFTDLTTNILLVNGPTIATSTFTNELDMNNLIVTGTTNLRYPPKQQMWVAVGNDTGGGNNTIKYSIDGINWNDATGEFTTRGIGVSWNGYMWVALGDDTGGKTIKYSSDGITWTNASVGGDGVFSGVGEGVAWNGSLWVAVGSGGGNTIKYSSDGITWSNALATGGGMFTTGGRGIAWNGTIWVAVGFEGGGGNTIKYSYDGSNWNNAASDFSQIGRGIDWNGYMWVAVGNDGGGNTIKYSYDGNNWINASTGGDGMFTTEGIDLAWNGYMWVAVGSEGGGGDTIKYSYDGINWTNAAAGGDGLFTGDGFGVSWNGSMWVAVGSDAANTIKYSYNGINWTNAAAGGGGDFVVEGLGVAYSTTNEPDLRMNNLNFYLQSQPTYLSSVNQIFTTASTIVVNNTLYVDQNSNSIGINRGFTEFTVDVLGNIRATSTIIARNGVYNTGGFYTTSDSNLKENITFADLNTCYNVVKNIPLHRYTFTNDYLDSKTDKYQLGFIAQEVQKEFPHAIVSMYDQQRQMDILHLNYDQIFMAQYGTTKVLIDKMRSQSTLLEQLNYYVNNLENQISTIKLN